MFVNNLLIINMLSIILIFFKNKLFLRYKPYEI